MAARKSLTPPGSTSKVGAANKTSPPPSTAPKVVKAEPKDDEFKLGATPIKFFGEDDVKPKVQAPTTVSPSQFRQVTTRRRSGVTVPGFVARVTILYTLLAYFLVCPNDPDASSRAVCRRLGQVEAILVSYEPTVRPYYTVAYQQVEPYVDAVTKMVSPYVEQVRPYYVKADTTLRPLVQRSSDAYFHHAHPRILAGIASSQAATKPYVALAGETYTSTIAPSVEWYGHEARQWYATKAEGPIQDVQVRTVEYYTRAHDAVAPVWTHGFPFVHKHYYDSVLPFASSTYKTSTTTYVTHIHPRLVKGLEHAYNFYLAKILPVLRRGYSLYIAPQADKISEKIFEYRTKKVKLEAIEHVVQVEKAVLAEKKEETLEEFIAELRDTTYTEVEDVPISPPVAAPTPEVIPTAEELAALTAEKRVVLEALQTTYEKEISKLGQSEHDLLVARLVEIRHNAVDDIPNRFNLVLENLDAEGDKMIGRLSKYFGTVGSDDKVSIEEKVTDAEFLAAKALSKVEKLAAVAKGEVDAYRLALGARETRAVEKATEALSTLVAKAQEELGYGWTWLDDVKYSDWQRFHKLAKVDSTWQSYYTGLQSGAIEDATLSPLAPFALLDEVNANIDSLVSTFAVILDSIKIKGQRELKGEWTGAVNEAQKVLEVIQENVANVVEVVAESASSLVGATATPSNAQQSIASVASSVYEAIPAVPTDYFVSVASQVVDAIPTPAVPTDYLLSASSIVSEAAQSAYTVAANAIPTEFPAVVVAASSVVASVIQDDVEAVSSVIVVDVPAAATSAYSAAAEAVESATEAAATVASVVSSLAAPHPAFTEAPPLASQISSVAEEVLSTVASVAAVVTEAVVEAVESVIPSALPSSTPIPIEWVQQAVPSVASEAQASVASVVEEIRSVVEEVVGTATFIAVEHVASASSVLHDATRTTPEGVQEHATSLAKAAASAVHLEL